MINYPKSIEEAKEFRYGAWAGNPNGSRYNKGKCAFEVWSDGFIARQCSRPTGYGPGKLYCKQHARIIRRRNR